MSIKAPKILLISALFLCAMAFGKPPIVIPVSDQTYLTLKDLDQIKFLFFSYVGGFTIWAAKAIYDIFLKKNDSTEKKLDDLISEFHSLNNKVDRFNGRLDSFATKNEVQSMIREDITFYDGLQRESKRE